MEGGSVFCKKMGFSKGVFFFFFFCEVDPHSDLRTQAHCPGVLKRFCRSLAPQSPSVRLCRYSKQSPPMPPTNHPPHFSFKIAPPRIFKKNSRLFYAIALIFRLFFFPFWLPQPYTRKIPVRCNELLLHALQPATLPRIFTRPFPFFDSEWSFRWHTRRCNSVPTPIFTPVTRKTKAGGARIRGQGRRGEPRWLKISARARGWCSASAGAHAWAGSALTRAPAAEWRCHCGGCDPLRRGARAGREGEFRGSGAGRVRFGRPGRPPNPRPSDRGLFLVCTCGIRATHPHPRACPRCTYRRFSVDPRRNTAKKGSGPARRESVRLPRYRARTFLGR